MKKFLIFLACAAIFLVGTIVNIVLLTIVYNVGIVPILTELGCKPIDMGYGIMTMIWFIYIYLHTVFGNRINIEDRKDLAQAIGDVSGRMISKSFIVLVMWILSIIIF